MSFACLAVPVRSFADTLIWTGLGDGASWSDPMNWTSGVVPGPADHAYLNNAWVGNSFTVTLPGGAATTTIERLTIYPGPKQSITLQLPATNTANPGLRVGDGASGTEDLDLRDSATLLNESGAGSGNGIEVASLANGTVRIRTGARYLHHSTTSAAGIAPRLVADATTAFGEFVYRVPGTQPFAISASGASYGSLTLLRLSPATYTASGSSPFVVNGDFTVGEGVGYASVMTGPLRLYGHLVSFPTQLTIAQPVEFAGFTFVDAGADTLELRLAAASTADSAYLQTDFDVTLELSGAFANGGGAEVSGDLRMADGADASGNAFLFGPSGRLAIVGATPRSVTAASPWWPATNGPLFVEVDAPVTLATTRPVSEWIARRALAGASPTYAVGSRLRYAGSNAAIGTEWAAGATLGLGVPYQVEVALAAAQTLALPTADRAVRGNLLVTSGTLSNPSAGARLRVSGDLIVGATGHLAGNGAIVFDGDLASPGGSRKLQTILGPAALSIPALALEKSDVGGVGMVRLLSDLTIVAPAGGTSLAFDGSNGVLDLNGHALRIDNGTVGGSDPAPYFYGSPTSSLSLRGAGPGGTLRFAGVAVAGADYAKLGTFSVQRIEGVTLDSFLEVSGTLALVAGRIVVSNAFKLSLPTTATVLGGAADAYVAGALERTLPVGSQLVTFPIGDALRYAPVDIYPHSLGAPLSLTASTSGTDHPLFASAGLNATKSVQRFHTLSASSATPVIYDAVFHFDAADVDPGSNPNLFVARRLPTTTWLATTAGTRGPTSAQVAGLHGFGAFQLGQPQLATLTVSEVIQYEGQSGFTPFLFSVLLSSPSPTDTVKVTYRTVAGTAVVTQDYNNATGTLVFPPNSDESGVIVFVKADAIPEGDENFSLLLTNPVKAILADTLARSVIRDDDGLTPVEPGAAPEFALERIFPNPAPGSFRVDFSLGRETDVSLTLHDVQGREVARLAGGTLPAGRHHAGWDAAARRTQLASGVYFVRYQAAGHTAIRRLVVLD